MSREYPGLEQLVAFHGHICPGLAIGYRATLAGLKRLGVERARDEELVAIVENDSCSVDAVQFLAGATFGKGNFFFRDWGKQVFTLAFRDSNQAVRVALKSGILNPPPAGAEASAGDEPGPVKGDSWRQEKIDYILNAPEDELFDIREAGIEIPPQARILRSVKCDSCSEPVMETRTVTKNRKTLCMECA